MKTLDVVLKRPPKKGVVRIPSIRVVERRPTAKEVVEQVKLLNNTDRLQVIEATSRLISEDMASQNKQQRTARGKQAEAGAIKLRDFYAPGSKHTEWTALDTEDFLDDTSPR